MKKTISGLLSLALAVMLTPAIYGAISAAGHGNNMTVSQPIPDNPAQEIVGSGPWSRFFNGVICGAGIVGLAAGALTGVGVAGAVVYVASVAGACVQAFD